MIKSLLHKTLPYIHISILFLSATLHAQEPFPDEATFAATLKEAQTAFRSYKPATAVELLEQVLNSPNESHRIKAGKYQAKLYADVFADYKKAKNVISKTIELNPEDSEGYLIFSKIACDYKDHSLAIKNGHLAIQKAVSKNEKIAAYSSLGEILLTAAIDERIGDANTKEIMVIDQDQLNTTITHLNRVLSLDPSQIELLKTKFALEILAGNGSDALASWKRYFNYSERSNPLLIKTFNDLKNALEDKSGNSTKKIALSKALANARNYELAMTIIRTLSQKEIDSDVRLQEIVNYHRFLRKADELITNFYRESVTSGENPKPFRNLFIANARELWDSYQWEGEPKEFSLDNVEIELDQRFGTCLRIGPANGWFSVTLGHKVIEYNTTIEQYGFTGDLAFRSLDYVISNGFIGWYFDESRIGGWESDDIIYQVRTTYLHGPFAAWNTVSDPVKVKEQQDAISQKMKNDFSSAKNNEVIIFPGMLDAMELKAKLGLYDDLTKSGLQGTDLRAKYLSEFENLTFDNSILSHEGRHFIDARIAEESGVKLPSEELEFRGKLSEIALAKYPFMALTAILKGGIDDTPHGIANKRIVVALYDWMDKNWKQVEGVEASFPKAPQLHLISDQQLITIVKSLDPLVKK
jgi:tetratricopeptide (TPR) repeat protein